jgi:hypothetical protein
MAFGEYLENRNYSEEAGFLYNTAGDRLKALECFKKSLNIDMCLSIAYQMTMTVEQIKELVDDLIERLCNQSRYEVIL